MKMKEIIEKINEAEKMLHVKTKEPKKEGDIYVSLVIIKGEKKINIRKEVYKEASFDKSVLLSDSSASESYSLKYENALELEIILLGIQRKYNVEDFHVINIK